MESEILEVTDDNFEMEVVNSKEPVMIDFYAEWCNPCKLLGPTMSELREEYEGRVKIAKSNIEDNGDLVKRFSISNIPSILLFKEGKVVDRHVGLRSKKDLQNDLKGVCHETA